MLVSYNKTPVNKALDYKGEEVGVAAYFGRRAVSAFVAPKWSMSSCKCLMPPNASKSNTSGLLASLAK
jgi:hypothetical protein